MVEKEKEKEKEKRAEPPSGVATERRAGCWELPRTTVETTDNCTAHTTTVQRATVHAVARGLLTGTGVARPAARCALMVIW